MLPIVSDHHAVLPMPDGSVASNAHAAELRRKLEMLTKDSGQCRLASAVPGVRSSQEKWDRPAVTHHRSMFSQLCLALICIRPVPQSRALSPLPLQSSPCHFTERCLSGSTVNACDDERALAGAGDRNLQPLLAHPVRMETQITVGWGHCVGYCDRDAVSESCFYVYGRRYALHDQRHLQRLLEGDRQHMDVLRFYRERLSHQWHASMFHTHSVFSQEECGFIAKAKIADDENFSYAVVSNGFPKRYGSAKIYYARCADDSVTTSSSLRVIELYGELVPVRTLNNGCYEVYRRDKSNAHALRVEWDGQRWIPARHEQSRIDRQLVATLARHPDIRQHDLSPRDMFFTDEKGIYHCQKNGNRYIKNGGDFFLLEPVKHFGNEYRIRHGEKQWTVTFTIDGGKLKLK